jgi:hypothetical protein
MLCPAFPARIEEGNQPTCVGINAVNVIGFEHVAATATAGVIRKRVPAATSARENMFDLGISTMTI